VFELRILAVIGTRPEYIKIAPVADALRGRGLDPLVCFSGQHQEMIGETEAQLGLACQIRIDPAPAGASLNGLLGHLVGALDKALEAARPDQVLVQGDTTTALAGALAAFNRRIPVAHVEAGLRTFDLARPWPEEANRRTIDGIAGLLFAPTRRARDNLLSERVGGRILLTGNTGIDALLAAVRRLDGEPGLRARVEAELPPADAGRRLVVVTGHRRETQGEGLLRICRGVEALAARGDVRIVYAAHLNPAVLATVRSVLEGTPNVCVAPPISYLAFVRLLQQAALVITDSGGIQEEAPALGKPLLVTRTETERPEAIETGAAELVGADPNALVRAASRLLDEPDHYARRAQRRLPFGDGRAAERIADALLGLRVAEFEPPSEVTPIEDYRDLPRTRARSRPT
jgi:UDP-N-acetylglucosamine 2-epimerase (non-hydrolysing)